jgi:hypothetical protein
MNSAVRYEEFRGKIRIVTAGRTGGIKRATRRRAAAALRSATVLPHRPPENLDSFIG